jgi:hypothetical protein
MVIYANHLIRAMIKTINSTLSEISKNGIVNLDNKIATIKEVFELQGMYEMIKNENEAVKLSKMKFMFSNEKNFDIIRRWNLKANQDKCISK